ncbi:MAG TPA: neutral/alkaline non-lysosomal ceramidase N-terminal domain-containing protein, partial [Longimicrobiales bacterium]
MRNLALVLITWSAACATVPRPVSPPPTPPAQPALRAGFGRVDITPPPGGGLFGYGPEGKKAVGYRMRLYARALVLEDATGERIAFVVTDLGANSVLVHRFAARATLPLGIGADRMLLAASHTHAGPTHHFGLIHDVFASGGEMGFDWPWAMELSGRVAKAVEMAVQDLRPARAGWRTFPVWSVTHNRNLLPYSKNQVPWQSRFAAPAGLTAEQKAIDPSWSMLKVETRAADGTYRPAGAVSIFAMHATGAPSANDLYDADLHGMVSSEIERGIDRLNSVPQQPTPNAFHLFAQG